MNRQTEKLFDAITDVREELVEQAQRYCFAKKTVQWQRYAGLAACMVLVVALGAGALRAGLINGMGGMGSSAADSATGNAADMDGGMLMDTTADTSANELPETDGAYGDKGSAAGSAPETSVGTESDGSDYAGTIFTATVLEVYDGGIAVKPDEDICGMEGADRIHVSTAEVEDLPALAEGDRVAVTYGGAIDNAKPARITAITVTVE